MQIKDKLSKWLLYSERDRVAHDDSFASVIFEMFCEPLKFSRTLL